MLTHTQGSDVVPGHKNFRLTQQRKTSSSIRMGHTLVELSNQVF